MESYPLHRIVQGVFFMCRYSILRGVGLMTFGVGLLIGCGMESGFWCCVLGIGAIISGIIFLQKK